MRRALVIGLLAVVAIGLSLLYAQRLPELRRQRLVGTWRCAHRPGQWHIVLREDGTGTMTDWDTARNRETRPRDISWSVDTRARHLSIQAVRPTGPYAGQLGGRYRFYGDNLDLDHPGGPTPGTYLYVRVQ
jgi:hypothetical protein